MQRCHDEFCARGFESKRQERTRDEQLAQRRVSLATLMLEHASELEAIRTPTDLTEFTRDHVDRLNATDFQRFAELMLARHGAAIVREAGLPSGTPSFRVA